MCAQPASGQCDHLYPPAQAALCLGGRGNRVSDGNLSLPTAGPQPETPPSKFMAFLETRNLDSDQQFQRAVADSQRLGNDGQPAVPDVHLLRGCGESGHRLGCGGMDDAVAFGQRALFSCVSDPGGNRPVHGSSPGREYGPSAVHCPGREGEFDHDFRCSPP